MRITPKTAPSVDSFLEGDGNEDEQNQGEKKEEVVPMDPLDAIAEQFKGAPSRAVIEGWRTSFGSVYAFVPDKDSLFLIRPLRRIEHRSIGRDVRQLAKSAAAQEDQSMVEEQLHEKVVTMCMLYPQVTPNFLTMSPAGLMSTIFNLIMEHSKFMSPETALDSCYKL